MAQLSFQFQYQYDQNSERVFVPIRLRSGNVVTTPPLYVVGSADCGTKAEAFR